MQIEIGGILSYFNSTTSTGATAAAVPVDVASRQYC